MGGPGLDELLGLSEAPREPVWQLRWFAGLGEGLVVDCVLHPPIHPEYHMEDAWFGWADVPPPDPGGPAWLLEEPEYSWGVAVAVLVDRQRANYEAAEDVEAAVDPDLGRWGAAPWNALLFLDGDLERATEELGIEVPPERPVYSGLQWAELFPEVVLASGSFAGALLPLTDEEQVWEEWWLHTVAEDHLEEELAPLFSGETLGGLRWADCPDWDGS